MAGLLLSLVIGPITGGSLLAVAYCRRSKNGHKTDSPKPETSRLGFARLALGLLIAGTIGTLLLITGFYRHGLAVIFSALTLILALVFGVLAWRQRMGRIIAITVLLILVAVGITVGIIVAVFTIGEAMQS